MHAFVARRMSLQDGRLGHRYMKAKALRPKDDVQRSVNGISYDKVMPRPRGQTKRTETKSLSNHALKLLVRPLTRLSLVVVVELESSAASLAAARARRPKRIIKGAMRVKRNPTKVHQNARDDHHVSFMEISRSWNVTHRPMVWYQSASLQSSPLGSSRSRRGQCQWQTRSKW